MYGGKPVIGVTMGLNGRRVALNEAYLAAVARAGGLALPLPPSWPVELGIDFLDGLVLSGGGDLDPFYFGQEPAPGLGAVSPRRDAFELAVTRLCLAELKPILGICRGHQLLCVAAGGRLHQDLPPGALQHQQIAPRDHASHAISVEPASLLGSLCGEVRRVNSFHHQTVSEVPPGFRVTAWAADGLVEAIEGGDGLYLGVQWHPEELPDSDDCAQAIFSQLVRRAGGGPLGRS